MTATLGLSPPVLAGLENGGAAARRAVVRWAWRLFRREWRQQLLILGLIVVAEAATIVGAAVATNTPVPLGATFGTAQDLATFPLGSPHVAAQIASLERHFGSVDVIQNQTVPVPGSVRTFQLRAQDPHGPFGRPMLSLVSGRYPTGPDQVAVTQGLASTLNLRAASAWTVGGRARRVVGTVENPQNLSDAFALVAPGQLTAPSQINVLFDAPGLRQLRGANPGAAPAGLPDSITANVQVRSDANQSGTFNPETISLAGLTLGMVLIALVAVGGFTVLAQRRLRALGMLASNGATDHHVALVMRANGVIVGAVGSLVGVALGVVAWLAYRPHLQSSAGHVIGTWALPWLVILLAVVLGLAATYFAASRPARAITRVSVVTALSGRPPPPAQLHRSALPGVVLLVIAFVILGYSGGQATGSGGLRLLVLGLLALVPAVILLSPLFLSVLARLGARAPVPVRLALRDLDRYRARSGSALAAISLGVLISVLIIIVAAARYGNALDYVGPNLASNQLALYVKGPGYAPPGVGSTVTGTQLQAMAKTAQGVATSLGARDVVELDSTSASLRHAAAGRNWSGDVYVATPDLLQVFGIPPAQVDPQADVLTRRSGIAGLSGMQLVYGAPLPKVGPGSRPGAGPDSGPPDDRLGSRGASDFPCPAGSCLANPVIQEIDALPGGTSAPNTVITEHAVSRLGLQTQTTGWLIQAPQTLTSSQINSARLAAAGAGMTTETKNDEPSSNQVIDLATAFGIALALAILAMSVGLIRSETASDLHTLTATGATSRTRRVLTAATAGGLGLLGALLGTVAGYVGVIGWLRTNSLNGGVAALGNVPVANLLAVLIGMPVLAAVIGLLLAGREPAMARQPMG
jgi:putative ABC transport system permease protein